MIGGTPGLLAAYIGSELAESAKAIKVAGIKAD